MSTVRVGDIVTVTEDNTNGIVIKIHADGGLSLRFADGDEGNYSEEEVE